MVMKRIFIKEEVCMGCRLCEIYCLVEHSKSKNIFKAFKEENPKALPRILVEERGALSFSLQCRHCEEPYCIEACMSGALYQDEKTGAVLHNKEQCVGCWMCLMVCPYGAIQRDLNGKKVASKCDLCVGKEMPVCVMKCPNEALEYKEV